MVGTSDAVRRRVIGLAIAAAVALPSAAQAADGDLDPSFGGTGIVERNLSPGSAGEGANAVVFDRQGRLLAAGTAFGQGTATGRFLADGTPDPAYDGDGYGYYNLPTRSPAVDAALLGDDRLAIAGFVDGGTNFDAIGAVINASGSLDGTWGNDPPNPTGDGVVRKAVNAGDDDLYLGAASDAQGRLVFAGRTGTNMTGGANDILVSRYGSDGAPDGSFGSGGTIVRNLATDDRGYDVLALPDGKILVLAASNSQYVLLRLNADGSPDSSFGTDGVLSIPGFVSPDAESGELAPAPDGSVVIVGTIGSFPNWKLGLARLAPNGALDSGFGDGGSTIIDAGQRTLPGGVAVGDDGRIIFGLNLRVGTEYHGEVRRLDAAGDPDPSFGGGGSAALPGAAESTISSIAITPDRRIAFGGSGSAGPALDSDFLVGRMLGDTVAPETAIEGKKRVKAKKKAKFRFTTTNDVNAGFECALKKPKRKGRHRAKPATFSPCASPLKTKKLRKTGKYKLLVRATDPAGNVEATPASKKFKVKRKRR